METYNKKEPVFEKLYNEWISTLLAYEEQMKTIDSVSRQMQMSVNDLHYQQEVQQLRNQILLQKNILGVLSSEVLQMRKSFSERNEKNVVSLEYLIENNRFRDKIRKAEQAIFMLKYQVNKLLSIAS
jgi:hypothetical protein